MEATTSLKLSKSSKKYLRCTFCMFRVFDRMNVTIMTCHSLAMLKLNTSSGARNLSQIIGIRITIAPVAKQSPHVKREQPNNWHQCHLTAARLQKNNLPFTGWSADSTQHPESTQSWKRLHLLSVENANERCELWICHLTKKISAKTVSSECKLFKPSVASCSRCQLTCLVRKSAVETNNALIQVEDAMTSSLERAYNALPAVHSFSHETVQQWNENFQREEP